MERVSVEELHGMLSSDLHPIIVDVRSPMAQAQGRIPGAIASSAGDALPTQAADKEVIVYCDCPNDASAAGYAVEANLPSGADIAARRARVWKIEPTVVDGDALECKKPAELYVHAGCRYCISRYETP
jgi:rhodanese-related sulfurtransferase